MCRTSIGVGSSIHFILLNISKVLNDSAWSDLEFFFSDNCESLVLSTDEFCKINYCWYSGSAYDPVIFPVKIGEYLKKIFEK